jgi:glutamate-1-semialdehyde 2,1-aminomutase
MRRGKGSRIWDVDDKEYVDFLLAYGPLILGHSPEKVVKKVTETIELGTLFGAPTEQEVQFGELLSRSSSLDMIRLVNTGTEATMHAIRLAKHFTNRKKVLKINGGYHGTHTFNFTSDLTESVEFNSIDAIEKKLSSKEFACLILEPVMGNIGVINPEPGYLEEVREVTEQTGTLMIVDEVITGYRTGFFPFYASKRLAPDLVTFAKIIGGGLPLAAYGGREEIMKEVRPSGTFPQAGTYSGNPVSVAAGLETLKILSEKNYSSLKDLTDVAVKLLSESGLTVNSQTGMLSVFFTGEPVRNASDAQRTRKELYFSLFERALKSGIYIAPSFDETIFISFAHNREEVEKAFQFISEEARKIWKGS